MGAEVLTGTTDARVDDARAVSALRRPTTAAEVTEAFKQRPVLEETLDGLLRAALEPAVQRPRRRRISRCGHIDVTGEDWIGGMWHSARAGWNPTPYKKGGAVRIMRTAWRGVVF